MLVLVFYIFHERLVLFPFFGQHLFLEKVPFLIFSVTVVVLPSVGPMGPRGLGPNPFSTVSQMPSGVFFSGKTASPKK